MHAWVSQYRFRGLAKWVRNSGLAPTVRHRMLKSFPVSYWLFWRNEVFFLLRIDGGNVIDKNCWLPPMVFFELDANGDLSAPDWPLNSFRRGNVPFEQSIAVCRALTYYSSSIQSRLGCFVESNRQPDSWKVSFKKEYICIIFIIEYSFNFQWKDQFGSLHWMISEWRSVKLISFTQIDLLV